MTPQTGRMVKEDGTTANIADLIGGTDTGERVNIDMMAPKSGRFVKEDGSVVNIAYTNHNRRRRRGSRSAAANHNWRDHIHIYRRGAGHSGNPGSSRAAGSFYYSGRQNVQL